MMTGKTSTVRQLHRTKQLAEEILCRTHIVPWSRCTGYNGRRLTPDTKLLSPEKLRRQWDFYHFQWSQSIETTRSPMAVESRKRQSSAVAPTNSRLPTWNSIDKRDPQSSKHTPCKYNNGIHKYRCWACLTRNLDLSLLIIVPRTHNLSSFGK